MSTTSKRVLSIAVAAAVAAAIIPVRAQAGAYPTNVCVSKKIKAAGKFCQGALTAWAKYQANPAADTGGVKRDAAIAKAAAKLAAVWDKADQGATKKGVDCTVTTVNASTAETDLRAAVDSLQTLIRAGGDDNDANDRKCRSKILKAAGKLCSGLLKAQSKHVKVPGKDRDRSKLTASRDKATAKFTDAYAKASPLCTAAAPAAASVTGEVTTVESDTMISTTTSPGLPTVFTQEIPPTTVTYKGEDLKPLCSKGTPYSFFYKRGTVNKLLMYYQGGGACWSDTTCWVANTFKNEAGPGDNPDLVGTGFADMNDPRNPFKDWHVVFVSYCTGDVHWGDADTRYSTAVIHHRGRVNAMVAEKFAREHFVDPDEVFVSGSSAGAYGAIMNSTFLLEEVYPSAQFEVVGDAGAGVITEAWLQTYIDNWGVAKRLPKFVPGLDVDPKQLSIVDVWTNIANHYPNARFAQYQTAYDGSGGGQAAFYNVMKNPLPLWTQWWTETCEWNACMTDFVHTIASRAPNFRYYTGPGSAHTIWGLDKLYEDTGPDGLMPKFVDWVQSMRAGDAGWVNVECADCNQVDTCQGGTDKGFTCATNGDCGGGGTCFLDPTPPTLPSPPYEPGRVVNCPPTTCPCGTVVNCSTP